MMKIVFRNMEKSDFVQNTTVDRMVSVFERFPDLSSNQVILTVSMENSPQKPGPDSYTVKFHCKDGRYKGVMLQKSATNVYVALADLIDHLLERLNRFGDKERVKNLKRKRCEFEKINSELILNGN